MDELGRPRRFLVLGICCMSLLIVGLDTTIVNVALPAIHRELKASVSGLQWTIDAYTLVLASLLMLAGSTGDRVGRRRVFQLGLIVFSLGSLLCGLAPSLGTLIGARVLQAIGVFGLAAACLIALVPYEMRREEPLLEMRFFSSAPFSGASAIAVCTFAGVGGFLFLNTLYLQEVRGFSPLHAGLYMLPMAAMTLLFAPISGRLVGRRGPRLPLLVAAAAMIASALMLTRLSATSTPDYLLVSYFLFGL